MVLFVVVAGFSSCSWYHKALKLAEKLVQDNKDLFLVKNEMVKETFREWIRAHKFTGKFTESPSVWLDDGSGADPQSNFVGGYEALEELAKRPVSTWFDKSAASASE